MCEVLDANSAIEKPGAAGVCCSVPKAERAGWLAGFVTGPEGDATLQPQTAEPGRLAFTNRWKKEDNSARKASIENPNLILENISHLNDEPRI